MNLYQYLGSNPWTNSDPLGLSSDPFADIDALIDEIYGSRAGTLSSIGKEAAAAAVIAANIASYLPFPGVGIVGDLALVALGEMTMDQVLMGAAIGIIPGGKLVKLLKKSDVFQHLGRIGSAAWSYAKRMAGSGGGFLGRVAGGLADRARRFLDRKPKAIACGCFTASTLVLTANGAVPIVDIEQGQQVLAAPDEGLAGDYSSNEVGAKIIIGEASLVQLVVLYEDGERETINTTDEHPFHVADTAQWTRADRLVVGDHLSTISSTAELQGVVYTTERVPVYNLSIPGSPTYYVGEHGVWVHNCKVFWELTKKGAAKKAKGKFGVYWKSASDGTWWIKDTAGHGGSQFKVYKESSGGLEWYKDADEFGDYIDGKHKGDVGLFIPWGDIKISEVN